MGGAGVQAAGLNTRRGAARVDALLLPQDYASVHAETASAGRVEWEEAEISHHRTVVRSEVARSSVAIGKLARGMDARDRLLGAIYKANLIDLGCIEYAVVVLIETEG